ATAAAVGTVALAIALCMLALVLVLQQNLRDSAKTDAKRAAVSVADQLTMSGKMKLAKNALVVTPQPVTIKATTGQRTTAGRATKAPRDVVFNGQVPAVLAVGAHTPYIVNVAPSTTAVDNATQ
ncbi:sensor histidine kinase, partial [Streptomyces sp. MCAF7]